MKIEFKKADLVPTMAKVGAFIGSLAEQKDYVLEIKPKPKRRSLDANAYMWALIGKLQAELAKNDPQITKDEIYRVYVRQYGRSVEYQLPDTAVEAWAGQRRRWTMVSTRAPRWCGSITAPVATERSAWLGS